jgi:hypothetical protein
MPAKRADFRRRNRGGRTRTCNPRFWRPVLCQLSYAPRGCRSIVSAAIRLSRGLQRGDRTSPRAVEDWTIRSLPPLLPSKRMSTDKEGFDGLGTPSGHRSCGSGRVDVPARAPSHLARFGERHVQPRVESRRGTAPAAARARRAFPGTGDRLRRHRRGRRGGDQRGTGARGRRCRSRRDRAVAPEPRAAQSEEKAGLSEFRNPLQAVFSTHGR